jgi:DUF1680 family protein
VKRLTLAFASFALLTGGLVFLRAGGPATPVVTQKARPLPLADVRLTGGPLKHAQDLDGQYLLSLEVDRMMALLRKSAGLDPRAEAYGGWDGPGRQLTGHIAGHYLSGVSLMYAATGDVRFKERADQLVAQLKEVQDKQGDGYIGAQADKDGVAAKVRFQELAGGTIRSAGFDLNGLWSPWYVLHKIYAGLRDAYRLTGNRTALEIEIKYAAWAEGILSKLDEGQIQRMLATEFGGMNEVMADLYADTGDGRWLALSDKFQHAAIIGPLARREDILQGKHGNTNVPKLLGSLARYIYTGNTTDGTAATFFWDQVALHHSFATGGHGRNEYFGAPDRLNDMTEGRTAETCNVYNMIKMARALFALQPEIRYADFHERALFNHILGSIDPEDGATCYMVPVGQGVTREYQNMTRSFTCCVGSGMESHALHADGIYYESGDTLWVNIYAPSTADWKSAGAGIAMETEFPDGDRTSITLTLQSPKTLTLALRRPAWAGDGVAVRVNGRPVPSISAPGTYLRITRTWKSGDRVELMLPKALWLEKLPDNPERAALMWGPLVLAGDLGPVPPRAPRGEPASPAPPKPAVPAIVTPAGPVSAWLKPVAGKPGAFRTEGVGRDRDVDFLPFYKLHRRVYAAYWDVMTPDSWQRHSAAILGAQKQQSRLEAATIAFAQPGQMQTERDFNQQGGSSAPAQLQGRFGRRAVDWFSFDLPVERGVALVLRVTYNRDERADRSFDILIDGTKIGEQRIARRSPQEKEDFFDVDYRVPGELAASKDKVTVRFQGTGASETATVFGIRMLRAAAAK